MCIRDSTNTMSNRTHFFKVIRGYMIIFSNNLIVTTLEDAVIDGDEIVR